ncbi:MFS transporter [Burkholderia sp. USMB20]|uniref:MFS transporter n=1 Tax=Burkholderia sp. USMB20 TaxID=1571773 RepID=UPI000AC69339|nr:MFS transporter [Burkholderia sp. USMB20]TGN95699.1 MFS transporter [Burkholderia sp. USMB20]
MANQSEAVAPADRLAVAFRDSSPHRRMLLSCFLGTTIEWYDFLAYGFLAPLVFDRLFFPKFGSLTATIAVLGIFAVGFAARPLGGLFFAHFGDRIGRKPVMVSTLILAGASTTAIGFTPTYSQIGVAAPLILTCLRFLQGFALGGESAAGPLLAMESAPQDKRGLFAAVVQSGGSAGAVLGALVTFAVGLLPDTQLSSWGWRVPFLLSTVIFLVGFYVRMKVEESPVFTLAMTRAKPERVPLLGVLRRCKKSALLVLCCALAESSTFYFTSVFSLSYAIQTLHQSRHLLLAGVVLGNAIGIATNPLFGGLSDKIGRRGLIGGSYTLAALYVLFLFFPLLRSTDPVLVVVALAIPGALVTPMSLGVSGSFYPELFKDARLRLSGVSLGRQFGTILGGGLMPMIAASLLAMSSGDLRWVMAYFVAVCVIAVGAVLVAGETARSELA